MKENSLELYRRQAIDAADGLLYGDECVTRLQQAKSEAEIERIMKDARHGKYKKE